MKELVLQRVKELIACKSKSVNEFSVNIGMGQVTVNNYVKGARSISLDFILHILMTYPDVSADWLLLGIGTMQRTNCAEVIINGRQDINGSNIVANSPNANQSINSNETIAFLQQTIQQQNETIKDLIASLRNNNNG